MRNYEELDTRKETFASGALGYVSEVGDDSDEDESGVDNMLEEENEENDGLAEYFWGHDELDLWMRKCLTERNDVMLSEGRSVQISLLNSLHYTYAET